MMRHVESLFGSQNLRALYVLVQANVPLDSFENWILCQA